jgi:hypothetical protein
VRLARIRIDGGPPIAAIERDRGELYPLTGDLAALFEGEEPRSLAEPVSEAVRLAPVAPGKVVAIGRN